MPPYCFIVFFKAHLTFRPELYALVSRLGSLFEQGGLPPEVGSGYGFFEILEGKRGMVSKSRNREQDCSAELQSWQWIRAHYSKLVLTPAVTSYIRCWMLDAEQSGKL